MSARLARPGDLTAIVGLRRHLADWLALQGSNQWQRAWPDEHGQIRRIEEAIDDRATWVVCEGDRVMATVTFFDYDVGRLWAEMGGGREPALYIHRMMVHRDYAGLGVGADILEAAHLYAAYRGLAWLRLDAWATNVKLHRYYGRHHFVLVGHVPDSVLERPDMTGFPSSALFQRRVRAVPGEQEKDLPSAGAGGVLRRGILPARSRG
ncbi:GNAT family N-acetyltransferase [Planotetraspora phitsanulokensis]|nr:GNAT family N-acetyltransferase [Planotetraspora phitsanulokensis]